MAGQSFAPHVALGLDPILVSTAILVVTYAAIIWDRLNRAIVALLGAAFAVLVGALDQAEALKGVDWNTIGTLAGMMIIVSSRSDRAFSSTSRSARPKWRRRTRRRCCLSCKSLPRLSRRSSTT